MSDVVRRDLARAAARLRNVAPARLLTAGLRALAFNLGLGPLVFRRDVSGRPERLVVTLTTTPARARHVGPALRSLIDQTVAADRIVLALPSVSRRDGAFYPDPAELGLPRGVEVLACDDEGPATKILPALRAEPDACLVVVDDDVVYPREFLATLLAAHQADRSVAFGWRGVRLEEGVRFVDLAHVFASGVREPVAVDVLFGTWGYLVPPGALDGAVHDFAGWPEAVRNVDDVWISGHLARRGVARRVVAAGMFPIETFATLRGSLTGGINRSGENDRIAVEAFADDFRRGHDQTSGVGPC